MHPVEALLTPLGRMFRNRHADETRSISHAPQLATQNHLVVTSPSFADGQEIPAKFCGRFIGENVSPAITWGELPVGTAELVLVMEDLDSPGTSPRLHAVAAFAPRNGGLPEGGLAAGTSGVSFLPGTSGPLTYAGPRPLPGHGPHHYRIHLYALDAAVDLAGLTGIEQLLAAASGHVLASGILTGIRES